ncbi:MAG: LicD family protein [Tidjanibacter sp.]|nr:LicD family protein [Tidjanibacter sp.]
MRYTPEILSGIHAELFDIIEEIERVCYLLGVKTFAIGGTAIGVHFWQNILPWDDDVDFGMLREDYNKFLREAPALLGEEFELQEFTTDPNTPFYWAKVRKRNTLFLEKGVEWFDISHGFFVDIFPFDRIPNNHLLERFHRAESAWFISAFSLYPYWQKRGEIPRRESLYYQKSLLSRLVLGVLYRLVSREWLYHKMCKEMGWFNGDKRCQRANVVRLPLDVAEYESLRNPRRMPFGRLSVNVPRDLEGYLHHHYPVLIKDIPEEQRVNHAPLRLSFDTLNGKTYE